ncbi:MAG TPA: ABC transporter substrate-binding protein, partial [Candidatus Methylomirabilis sp.]|nr:ABC transporter substrate-binding protein [Candidatus Methylomirabilis sp.]
LVLGVVLAGTFPLAARPTAAGQTKPAELKIGVVSFLSGPATVFGVPSKNAAEWLIDKYNREGGIGGVKIRPVYVDEAGGAEKQVAEFRRLVLDEKVDLVIGYISSADCLAVTPVAEELRMLTVLFDCGTNRIFEDHKYKYVFRTKAHQILDSVAAAKYVLSVKPGVKTIAGINQDYAWGRDSWESFRRAMLKLKPDIQVVAELWPKLLAGEYSAEISRLLAAKPDVIHSSFWNGDIIGLVKQGAPRGLFSQSLVVLTAGEHMLQDVGKDMPEGVVIGARGDHWFLHNSNDPLHKEFVDGYRAKYGRYPIYPSYHMYQAVAGVKAAFEKAMKDAGGAWPTQDQVIKAFEGIEYRVPPGRTMTIRGDHNGIEPAIVGLTKHDPKYPFAILVQMTVFPAVEVNPPLGVKSNDWIEGWKK